MPRRSLVLLVVLGCLAAALSPAAATAPAAPPWTANRAQLDRTIRFLQDVQNADGGFGGQRGKASDETFSAWVAIALAAGGVNPQDQKRAGGRDVYAYVTSKAAKLSYTTDLDRAMLVSIAAGTSPHDFGGRDLVAEVLARQLPDGSFPHTLGGTTGGINDTVFAILPLSRVDEPGVRAALEHALDWVLDQQAESGAWSFTPRGETSTDMTAAVIQALRALGRADTAQEHDGWEYIRFFQQPDGGFAYGATNPGSNTASTSWVVQAMWAAGVDPATWRQDGRSPLDYLASMQREDGAIDWNTGSKHDMNDVWMTAYATPAFAGYPLPVVGPPRSEPVANAPTDANGVTSGGGGNGAPLFSRPQPQSDGDVSGGVRRVRNAARRATPPGTATPKPEPATTRRRPRAKTSATGTAQSNGVADSGVTPVASAERKSGGNHTEKPVTTPAKPPARAADGGGGGGGTEVTGRVLGRAPAGVGGRGKDEGFAPGLRSAAPDPGSPETAIVLAILLAGAMLAGANIETRSGRGVLVP